MAERKEGEALRIQTRILESMADGVNVSDENAIILFVNPAFDATSGCEQRELIGKHVSILNAGPLEERDRIVGEIPD